MCWLVEEREIVDEEGGVEIRYLNEKDIEQNQWVVEVEIGIDDEGEEYDK